MLQSIIQKRSLLISLLFAVGSLLCSPSLYAATVEGIRVWRAPDHTRIVFDLSGPVDHVVATLGNPERLVLDITNAQLNANPDTLPLENTPVQKIRSGVQNKTDLRIVLDLSTKVQPRSFLLKPFSGNPDRLVLDLYDLQPRTDESESVSVTPPEVAVATTDVKPTVATIPEPATIPQPATKTQASVNAGERDIIIAVDAGHGGEDPGAIGPNRLREKDITLMISKELIAAFNAEKGFKAKLVRSGDYFIPLKKRRDIARNMQADLFVSIHADAFKKSSARGASVFALSRHGATSETARFLAQRENEADLIGGVGGISLEDKDEVLAGVLVDLSMTATLNSSLQVGHHVLGSMGNIARLHKNHVEQAGFMVLKSPDVPSILIETGFISNPEEARKLATASYRKQMANSVFTGIRQFFMQNPPAGTYIAARQHDGSAKSVAREHIIAPGDTLTAIAQRYRVSVNQLLSHNGMKNHVIKVGQTLKIPAS